MNNYEAIAELKRKKKDLTQDAFVNSSRNGVPHLVQEYLAAGFDVNTRNKNGESALGVAVESNDVDMVHLLIDVGAKADDVTYFFDAVYGAPFIDSVEIIDLLVAEGCPVDFIEETTGFNALELARDMGSPLVIERLEAIFGVSNNGT